MEDVGQPFGKKSNVLHLKSDRIGYLASVDQNFADRRKYHVFIGQVTQGVVEQDGAVAFDDCFRQKSHCSLVSRYNSIMGNVVTAQRDTLPDTLDVQHGRFCPDKIKHHEVTQAARPS